MARAAGAATPVDSRAHSWSRSATLGRSCRAAAAASARQQQGPKQRGKAQHPLVRALLLVHRHLGQRTGHLLARKQAVPRACGRSQEGQRRLMWGSDNQKGPPPLLEEA